MLVSQIRICAVSVVHVVSRPGREGLEPPNGRTNQDGPAESYPSSSSCRTAWMSCPAPYSLASLGRIVRGLGGCEDTYGEEKPPWPPLVRGARSGGCGERRGTIAETRRLVEHIDRIDRHFPFERAEDYGVVAVVGVVAGVEDGGGAVLVGVEIEVGELAAVQEEFAAAEGGALRRPEAKATAAVVPFDPAAGCLGDGAGAEAIQRRLDGLLPLGRTDARSGQSFDVEPG